MHKTFTREIVPGVRLTGINTDKFKTGCLTINLIGGLSRETAALSALLPRVLLRGSSEFPDMDHISAALDELYGARLVPLVRKKGELHCVGFYADFPDDRYIPQEEGILEKTAMMVGGILLSPNMLDGLFREEYVEGEKSNLVDDIRAAINDKRGYSIDRLLEKMCAEEAYGVGKLGREDEAVAITRESLTAHYHKLIADSQIEVLYCGSAEPDRVLSALRKALQNLPKRNKTEAPKTKILLYPEKGSPRRFTESLDITQGKLTIGFRMGRAMETPDYPAFFVFSSLYGGSVTSKLFLNVREKLSLCYYVSSMLDKHKGVMIVASGVEISNFDTALSEIIAQLESVKKGDISDWEFTSAKRYVATSMKAAMDRPGGLEELYFDSMITATPYDPIKLCESIETVTLDRVVEIASEIEPDSIFFLKNEEGGGEIDS